MKNRLLYLLTFICILGIACSKNDPPLPDNTVNFSTNALGFEDNVSELSLKLSTAREVASATSITVDLVANGLVYGTDFTTEPAAVDNKITVNVPAGSSEVNIKLKKVSGVFFNGNESINLKISDVGAPAVVGDGPEMKISFSAITSTGTRIQLEGGTGGASAVNSVFLDLSANKQTSVTRTSWDLGFYSGNEFRVILNNTTAATTIKVDKTDLASVSGADIDANNLKIGQGQGNFSIIDGVSGDIATTAIAEISATDADNKVYVINRASGSGNVADVADLYKVRILRKNSGYTLQYAKLNETTFKSVDIAKQPGVNFTAFSFGTNTTVSVEPVKEKWDIVWGYSIYFTGAIPYAFSDLVFINHLAGVSAAEVLTSTVSYDAYAESNVASTAFKAERNVIGSNWRATTGTVGVKTDRFYVIKDGAGNVYKLKFVSFTTQDGGERGKPVIEYALVKKAS